MLTTGRVAGLRRCRKYSTRDSWLTRSKVRQMGLL